MYRGWVCGRCLAAVKVEESADPPRGWTWDGATGYCVDCSRERAAEAAQAAMPLAGSEEIQHISKDARILFELERDPDRSDSEIARLCGTSVLGVLNARKRLPLRPD